MSSRTHRLHSSLPTRRDIKCSSSLQTIHRLSTGQPRGRQKCLSSLNIMWRALDPVSDWKPSAGMNVVERHGRRPRTAVVMHVMFKSTDMAVSHQTLPFPSYHEVSLHCFAEIRALTAMSDTDRHISNPTRLCCTAIYHDSWHTTRRAMWRLIPAPPLQQRR